MKFRSIEDFKEFRKAYSACLNEAIDAAKRQGESETSKLEVGRNFTFLRVASKRTS